MHAVLDRGCRAVGIAQVVAQLFADPTDGGAALGSYRRAAGPGVALIGLAAFPVPDAAAQAARIGADERVLTPSG